MGVAINSLTALRQIEGNLRKPVLTTNLFVVSREPRDWHRTAVDYVLWSQACGGQAVQCELGCEMGFGA